MQLTQLPKSKFAAEQMPSRDDTEHMRDQSLVKSVAGSFKLLLLCATFCMFCLVMAQVASLRLIGTGSKAHVLAFEPAKQLTASFDHEMLSASLSFSSFASTQQPDSLAAGWKHYHLAESRLHDLNTLIGDYSQLSYLRPAADRLSQDLSAYGATLTSTVTMLQSGESKGPRLDAQMQEWTAHSAAIEIDTATLETLTFRLSDANTNGIAQWISDGEWSGWLLLSISFFIYYLLTRILRRKLLRQLDSDEPDGLSIMEPIRAASAPAVKFGAH